MSHARLEERKEADADADEMQRRLHYGLVTYAELCPGCTYCGRFDERPIVARERRYRVPKHPFPTPPRSVRHQRGGVREKRWSV